MGGRGGGCPVVVVARVKKLRWRRTGNVHWAVMSDKNLQCWVHGVFLAPGVLVGRRWRVLRKARVGWDVYAEGTCKKVRVAKELCEIVIRTAMKEDPCL